MHINEGRQVTTTHFLQLFPHLTFRANSAEFLIFSNFFNMSMHGCNKFKVLDEVFIDEYSHFDPDIADSLSKSSQQSEQNRLAR